MRCNLSHPWTIHESAWMVGRPSWTVRRQAWAGRWLTRAAQVRTGRRRRRSSAAFCRCRAPRCCSASACGNRRAPSGELQQSVEALPGHRRVEELLRGREVGQYRLAILDTLITGEGANHNPEVPEILASPVKHHPSVSVDHLRRLGDMDAQLVYFVEQTNEAGLLPSRSWLFYSSLVARK